MAIVNIKDAEVTRLHRTGNGVQVVEVYKEFKTYYTVWFSEPSGLREGDRVSLSGFLSVKVGEPWTDKDGLERRSAEISINSPRLNSSASAPADSFDPSMPF